MTTAKAERTLDELIKANVIPSIPNKLGPKDKELWADSAFPFTILSTVLMHGDKGDYWLHTVERMGEQYRFDLQADGTRDPIELAIASALADGPISNCYLVTLSVNQGNHYLVIGTAGS